MLQVIEEEKETRASAPNLYGSIERTVKKADAQITDWDTYRKKHKLKKNDKIFICRGYRPFQKALLSRGWKQNNDVNSPIFHLKFCK